MTNFSLAFSELIAGIVREFKKFFIAVTQSKIAESITQPVYEPAQHKRILNPQSALRFNELIWRFIVDDVMIKDLVDFSLHTPAIWSDMIKNFSKQEVAAIRKILAAIMREYCDRKDLSMAFLRDLQVFTM